MDEQPKRDQVRAAHELGDPRQGGAAVPPKDGRHLVCPPTDIATGIIGRGFVGTQLIPQGVGLALRSAPIVPGRLGDLLSAPRP